MTGIEYLVIDDSYRFKKVFHRQYSKNKFKIFASFGGYDHLGFVRKFLKMIEKHICDGSKNFEFNIIGGYDCLKDKENLATIKELNKNIHNDIFYFSKPTNFL